MGERMHAGTAQAGNERTNAYQREKQIDIVVQQRNEKFVFAQRVGAVATPQRILDHLDLLAARAHGGCNQADEPVFDALGKRKARALVGKGIL